ncbi:MAG: 50S ribosomal protein L11 methyltransferase [Betaproteobacteria bacterium]|nr:50S ribosomal protein L11 methyltransferase [Betaproteobacteria bacterium]
MLAVTLIVDARCVDTFSDILLAAGALSVDVSDAAAGTRRERPLFAEPGSAPQSNWPVSRLVALFAAGTDVAGLMPAALRAASLPQTATYGIDTVHEQDWVRLTQGQFTPQRVSPRLWVVPTWHEIVDPAAINIRLDPGLAFGTGTHPTTQLCLRWLVQHLRRGESVIDYGCGSGILAIAAMKLGASRAAGVDIDDQALVAARRNAVQNHSEVAFYAAADAIQSRADVVVANILANPLTVLAPLLARLTLPRGRVVLSGILRAQADEVRDAYQPWFNMYGTEHEDDWVLLAGAKRDGDDGRGRRDGA